MTTGQHNRRRRQGHDASGQRARGSLVAHGAFAPILGLWGAALGGLATLVLPQTLIASLVMQTGLAAYSGLTQPVLAGIAALVLGGVMFAIAAKFSRRARRRADTPSIVEIAARRVRPIDPTRDLGSRSLDDPLDTMPFAAPAWQTEAAEPQPQAAPQPEPEMPAPVELDLAQFAEWPGRNAVWVEESVTPAAPTEPAPLAEPAPAPASAPVACAPVSALRPSAPPADPSAAALARLRAVPPSELSLAEMVERFAGALHEQRSTASGKALGAHDLAAREAALAEALKALAALSNDGNVPVQSEPLRATLARLQGQRGAA